LEKVNFQVKTRDNANQLRNKYTFYILSTLHFYNLHLLTMLLLETISWSKINIFGVLVLTSGMKK